MIAYPLYHNKIDKFEFEREKPKSLLPISCHWSFPAPRDSLKKPTCFLKFSGVLERNQWYALGKGALILESGHLNGFQRRKASNR